VWNKKFQEENDMKAGQILAPQVDGSLDDYWSNDPAVLRSLISAERAKAEDWKTRYFEQQASHTESNGMLAQERDRALERLSETVRDAAQLATERLQAEERCAEALRQRDARTVYAERRDEALLACIEKLEEAVILAPNAIDTGEWRANARRALAEARAALEKNPNPSGQLTAEASLSQRSEASGSVGLGPQEAEADSADFEAGTWTFRMPEGFRVAAGRFLITPLNGVGTVEGSQK
jgi:hypothetical protein